MLTVITNKVVFEVKSVSTTLLFFLRLKNLIVITMTNILTSIFKQVFSFCMSQLRLFSSSIF